MNEQSWEDLREYAEERESVALKNRTVPNDVNYGVFWYGYSVGVKQVLEYMEVIEEREVEDYQ